MVNAFINFPGRVNTRIISLFLFLCVFLVGTIDYATGVEFSFSIFYILTSSFTFGYRLLSSFVSITFSLSSSASIGDL